MPCVVQALSVARLFTLAAPEARGGDRAPVSTGSVCIPRPASRTPNGPGDVPLTNSSVPDTAKFHSLKVDGGPRQAITGESVLLVPDLDIGKRHLVRIFGDDTQIQSFWFRFVSYRSRHLCLSNDHLYRTWRLFEAKEDEASCRCPEA
jgi:hypothetical protein